MNGVYSLMRDWEGVPSCAHENGKRIDGIKLIGFFSHLQLVNINLVITLVRTDRVVIFGTKVRHQIFVMKVRFPIQRMKHYYLFPPAPSILLDLSYNLCRYCVLYLAKFEFQDRLDSILRFIFLGFVVLVHYIHEFEQGEHRFLSPLSKSATYQWPAFALLILCGVDQV